MVGLPPISPCQAVWNTIYGEGLTQAQEKFTRPISCPSVDLLYRLSARRVKMDVHRESFCNLYPYQHDCLKSYPSLYAQSFSQTYTNLLDWLVVARYRGLNLYRDGG